ncbi:MAG: DNA-binding protein [Microcystis novacekii Mn_MB_F_20050700_S1]|uniref:DNA-binding protein n=2 Tax=Microcystis TaxID=1125 RepID=A0A552IKK8_9CHRO|nr:MAG: DNA-binding protein [Microcystis aeruginosa Ma_QC_C_20070703_M131]TRU82648.1 MAG: DNA-binding protein [Microcystis novacekii Mn_MB_F_20050700_S1]TRU83987.1 MAG: DNA-binding protein [Microcystis novacekii Mn_MB_F_20050700_S1D]
MISQRREDSEREHLDQFCQATGGTKTDVLRELIR